MPDTMMGSRGVKPITTQTGAPENPISAGAKAWNV